MEKSYFFGFVNKIVMIPEDSDLTGEMETEIHHIPLEVERAILNCFRTGDIKLYNTTMDNIINSPTFFGFGKVSDNQLRMMKYACIIFGALSVRAAIEGGVPEIFAFSISDDFIRSIDRAASVRDLAEAFPPLRELIYLAGERGKCLSNDAMIRKCENYICNNLVSKLSRNKLAEICGVTPNYLSARFKKETGMSITDYILKYRMHMAKQMLTAERIPISQIAYSLGFSTQSYFITVFKKYYGVTPRVFRQQSTQP